MLQRIGLRINNLGSVLYLSLVSTHSLEYSVYGMRGWICSLVIVFGTFKDNI